MVKRMFLALAAVSLICALFFALAANAQAYDVKYDAKNVYAWRRMADLKAKQGKDHEAIPRYKKAIKVYNPANSIFEYFFAVLAMLVGGLQIKDFFFYKKGSFATETPIWMMVKAKRIIEKITSPIGAFFTGFIITLFLSPCTMAPLLVATETLSQFGLLGALPWLLYFNFIVILPLIVIILIVYKGFTTAEKISEWRNRNIKIMHLIAGIILLAVGIALLMGWL